MFIISTDWYKYLFTEKHIKNRWRNLVTCFRRELKKQKGKSGRVKTKRRKYLHFDNLLFLLPTMDDRLTKSEDAGSISSVNSDSDIDHSTLEEIKDVLGFCESTNSRKESLKEGCQIKKQTYEERLLGILENEEVDEDRCFLLSLVPSFKKMNDVQKLEAKMAFLSTIKGIIVQNQSVQGQASHFVQYT